MDASAWVWSRTSLVVVELRPRSQELVRRVTPGRVMRSVVSVRLFPLYHLSQLTLGLDVFAYVHGDYRS